MPQVGWIMDLGKCVGCRACTVACAMENNTSTVNYRWVIETETGAYPTPSVSFFSLGCYHCADPACVAACPTGGITKRTSDGVVLIDQDACIGCKYCMAACPYGAPQFNEVTQKVEKCTYCIARADAMLGPACARTCVGGAIQAATDDTWGGAVPDGHVQLGLTNASVKFIDSTG
jgi:Fe-S-cluster-containing dehydrogenase component